MALFHFFWQERGLPPLGQRVSLGSSCDNNSVGYIPRLKLYLLLSFPSAVSISRPSRSCCIGTFGLPSDWSWLFRRELRETTQAILWAYPWLCFHKMLTSFWETHTPRIGLNELHISYVRRYKIIYGQSKPFLKDGTFYEAFDTPCRFQTLTFMPSYGKPSMIQILPECSSWLDYLVSISSSCFSRRYSSNFQFADRLCQRIIESQDGSLRTSTTSGSARSSMAFRCWQ